MNSLLASFQNKGIPLDSAVILRVKRRLLLGYPYTGGVCYTLRDASELFCKDCLIAKALMSYHIKARTENVGYTDIPLEVFGSMSFQERVDIRVERIGMLMDAFNEALK